MSAPVRFLVELVYLAALVAVLWGWAHTLLHIRRDAQSGSVSHANTRTTFEKPYKRRKCVRSDVPALEADSGSLWRVRFGPELVCLKVTALSLRLEVRLTATAYH